jgi:hypothetical protein
VAKTKRSITSALTLAAVVLLLAAPAAQSGRASVRGLVTDPGGGTIAQADVSAVNDATGEVTLGRTDNRGNYALLNLPVGHYTVTVSAPGFGPFVHRALELGVQSAVTLDARLALAEFTQGLTVSAQSPPLDARLSSVGTTLSNQTVTALPLNITSGRSIENFAYAVVPGVEGNNWTANIVGGTAFSKEVMLDGTSATIQIQGHITESSPPLEAVEEFKVETSGMAAEYGRTGGGMFNFSLRSGTNQMHGSVHGQLRNEALNANTAMNEYLAAADPAQAARYETPEDRQRLGGFSAGGPLVSNRTFYFGAFEQYRQSRDQLGPYDRTVPTPAFLNGDFSALLDRTAVLGTDAAGQPIYRGAIFDPRTRLVFPGNVIPSNRISAVSRRITDLYRAAYQPVDANRLINNAAGPAYIDPSFTQQQASIKLDHGLNPGSRLAGSLVWTNRPRVLADQGGIWDPSDEVGGPLSKARRHEVTTYQGRASHSQVLSPSVLQVATVTFSRFRNPSTSGSGDGDWPSQLGLSVPGAYGSFPEIAFGDAVNGINTTPVGYGISNYYVADVLQVNDSLSWSKGRHLFKAGGELRLLEMSSYGDRAYLSYGFSPTQTGVQGGPLANQVGFGFASFLLGEVGAASQHVPTDLSGQRNYGALFIQDEMRVTDAMTLSLGLRWETTGGWRERDGRWANFNINRINPVTGVAGTLEYADQVEGSFEGKRRYNQFGPRIGVAYRLADRLVARGAYGVFYAPIGTNFWSGVPYGFAPGYYGVNAVPQTADGSPAFNWDQTAYPGSTTAPTRDPAYTQWGLVSNSPQSLDAGSVQQWNIGLEHQAFGDVTLGVAYVGNRGSGLPSGDLERNQPDPAAMRQLLNAGTEWNWVSDASSAAAAGVPYPYPGFAGTAWMAITPYPQAAAGWGPLFFVGSPLGSTRYHALQFTANKRSSHGVSAATSYVLSRQRGNLDSVFQERWGTGNIQDVTQLDREAGVIASTDRTHVAKGYIAWSLPMGPGRRFFGGAGGFVSALVSGWTVSGIFRYESGLPLAVSSSNSYAGWQYPIYANRNPEISLERQFDSSAFNPAKPADPANRYFDPRAFSNPAYGELGTGPGRFEQLRGFGNAYEDLGIVKEFAVGHVRAQVKLEVINLFNRQYFADPDTRVGSPNFGQVTTLGWQPPRQGQLGIRFDW